MRLLKEQAGTEANLGGPGAAGNWSDFTGRNMPIKIAVCIFRNEKKRHYFLNVASMHIDTTNINGHAVRNLETDMAHVNPFILKVQRNRKRLTQERLADIAGVDKQTIWRIEKGKLDNTRPGTIKKLARALDIEPAELTREAPTVGMARESEPVQKRSQSSFGVSTTADNFLYLISERYFVKPWQVMELAPLLFCWAAEMSLRARREHLKKLKGACESARSLEEEMRHLPGSNFTYSEEKITAESDSIDRHDLFGTFADDAFADGPFYSPSDDTDNPFAMFLTKLVRDIGDVASFEGFSSIDYPIYQVCHEEALNLLGRDEKLAESILNGVTVLGEMPKELQGTSGKTKERAEWVRAQVEEDLQSFVSNTDL
jgi:transcriptional regulator with XRE-family HTH domain